MQLVGKAFGSVSKTWSSINPATLSGAIDVIVVEQESGDLHCSPFHVRFGKFQLLRPRQKKVDFIVNGECTDLPMKLGDGGEAFFVFETEGYVPSDLQTSPVVSPLSSPSSSPQSQASVVSGGEDEPDYLDIGEGANDDSVSVSANSFNSDITPAPKPNTDPAQVLSAPSTGMTNTTSHSSLLRAHEISKKFTKKNIPSKVEANGDIMLDIQGYKSSARDIEDSDVVIQQLLQEEFGPEVDLKSLIDKDLHGNIRILSTEDLNSDSSSIPPQSPNSAPSTSLDSPVISDIDTDTTTTRKETFFKTLRLTSEQLKCLSLKQGENDIRFAVNKGKSVINAKLFLWKHNVPIVISDIDGTITKSDALGHFLNMIGRDWTHEGVTQLFSDIQFNGYNIIYLTARSVGLADTTRLYLNGVIQDGIKLPAGPVILSPDRTIAALRREIVLKKPEVFKMACLSDIMSLYGVNIEDDDSVNVAENDVSADLTNSSIGSTHNFKSAEQIADSKTENILQKTTSITITQKAKSRINGTTPFYAGFGNRITDALSYRYVGIPSSRIFTINPEGDVCMELLEMAGFKSSYMSIGELVDQFFPPVNLSKINKGEREIALTNSTNQFSDLNFWRNPIINLSDLSDDDDDVNDDDGLGSLSNAESPQDVKTNRPSSPITSFFSRSPSVKPTDVNDEFEHDELDPDHDYVDEDDEFDDNPDYVYEDDFDGDEDVDEDEETDDYDAVDDDYDEDDEIETEQEKEQSMILNSEPHVLLPENTLSPISTNPILNVTPKKSASMIGITDGRSLSPSLSSNQVHGTFISAKNMLGKLSLEDDKNSSKQ